MLIVLRVQSSQKQDLQSLVDILMCCNHFLLILNLDLSCVRDKRSFERKKRIQDLKTRKREEDKSCRGEYRIDTDAYLHEDKIREIMNMDQLEETLAEVLTISSDDMDDMFSSPRLSTDSEGKFTKYLVTIISQIVTRYL